MIWGILLALGAVIAILLLLLRSRRARAHVVERLAPADLFPATPGGAILRRYISAISDPGAGEARVAELGRVLAGRADEVLPALTEVWRRIPYGETGLRWALVYAAPLMGPAAMPFLREVVLSPVLPERSPDPHAHSTKAQDSIVRSRAVAGLESLAAAGASEAIPALFDCLSHELFSIRALAAIALMHLPGGDERREQVQRALPETERSVVAIERVRVSVVPQVRDPRTHLSSPLGRGVPRPPSPSDDGPGQSPRGSRTRGRRTPPPTIRGDDNG